MFTWQSARIAAQDLGAKSNKVDISRGTTVSIDKSTNLFYYASRFTASQLVEEAVIKHVEPAEIRMTVNRLSN